jgi:hypothetical protein
MKNSTAGLYGRNTFQDEADASAAWESYLKHHLGPAAPRPEVAGLTRLAFCAGYLAAKAGR